MPTTKKQDLIVEIKDKFANAGGVIVADYRGLTVKDMRAFRTSLREVGGEATVYKNSLAQIAIRELELPNMDELLVGPTLFVFTTGDPVATTKAIVDFAKGRGSFAAKGGLVDGRVISADDVKALASLPSREELIAKLMGTMLNPLRGFMGMCNAPVSAFARVIQAVADQKAAA